MSISNFGRNLLSFSAILAIAGSALPGTASAQLFFDWGGGGKELFFDWGGPEKKVNDSGREYVRINADAKPGDIIVSFSDRRLYLFTQPGLALSYPVAIPREQDRWEGATVVSQKRDNPSWTPTPDMIKENPRLPRWVPGGHPMNPLGVRALYLGSSFYRIHGTDAPWTIGTAVSKGCIRMYNKDALDVYDRTKIGAKVLVTWKNYQFSPASDPIPPIGEAAASAGGNARATNASLRGGERDPQAAPRRHRAQVNQDDNGSGHGAVAAVHHPASSEMQPKAARQNAATSPVERKPRPKPATSAAVPAAPAVAAPTSPASGGNPTDADEHSAAPSQNGAAVAEPAERAPAKTAVAPAEARSAPEAAQE